MSQEARKLKEAYIESARKFGMQINYTMIHAIENAKENNDKLLSLDLSHQNLYNEDLYPLLDALKKTKSVQEVNVSYNHITVTLLCSILSHQIHQDVSFFSDILIMNKKLEHLNLANNPIHYSTIPPLLESASSPYSCIIKIDLTDYTNPNLENNDLRKVHFVREEKEKPDVDSSEKENLMSGMYFSFNPNYNNKSPPRPAFEKESPPPQQKGWKDFFIKFYNQALLDSYDGIVKTQVLVDLIILQECDDLMKSSSSKLDKNYEQQNLRYLELEKNISKLAIQHPQVIDYEDICRFFDNNNHAVITKKKELSPCQEEVSLENIETERDAVKPPSKSNLSSAIRIINCENDLKRQSSDSLSTIKHDSYIISGFENGGISRNLTEITRFSLNNTVTDDAFQSMLFPSTASSPTAMGEFNLKDFETVNQPYKNETLELGEYNSRLARNPSRENEQRQTIVSNNHFSDISGEFKTRIQGLKNEVEAMNIFVHENQAILSSADLEIVHQINRYHELIPSENWATSIRLALKRIKHPDLHNSKVFPAMKRVLHLVQVFKLSSSELSQNSLTGLLGINLRVLNLSRNNIQNLKFLISCRNLEFINLSHNQLTTVEGFILCPNLQEIILSNNKIDSIKTLARCSNLRLLDLSFNKLRSVEQLQKLSLNNKLSVLNLNGNEVIWEKGYKIKLDKILPNLRTLDPPYIIDHSNYKSFEEYTFNLKWSNPGKKDAHSETFSQPFSDDSLLLRKIQSDFSFPQTVAI